MTKSGQTQSGLAYLVTVTAAMTLMCLAQAGHCFKAGVAVAPVADWRLYDSHYTERFMGLPADNEDAYNNSCVILTWSTWNALASMVWLTTMSYYSTAPC